MKIVLPFATKSLNQTLRQHWAARRRDNQRTYALIRAAALERHGTRYEAPELARVTLTRIGARRLDADNLVGSMKPVIDGLVRAGLARDDTPDAITVEYRQETHRTRQATIVEVHQ